VLIALVLTALALRGGAEWSRRQRGVKRGWTTWAIPNVLNPKLSIAWALIVVGAGALYAIASEPAR